MNTSTSINTEQEDTEGFAKNTGSPALDAALNKAQQTILNSDLLKPIDWEAAFRGVTVYYPR